MRNLLRNLALAMVVGSFLIAVPCFAKGKAKAAKVSKKSDKAKKAKRT